MLSSLAAAPVLAQLQELLGVAASPRAGARVAEEAQGRSRNHRAAMAFVTAIISSYWVGPMAAAGWLALVLLYEMVVLPWYLRTFIHPIQKSQPDTARVRAMMVTAVGGALFVLGWAPSWATGGEGAGYFAALWLACALIHALVYNSNDRAMFMCSCGPAVITSFAMPFYVHGASLLVAVVLILATGRILLTTWIAQRDRNALLGSVTENRMERKAAEQANIAKSQFLATMSHELRTPLNAVIGYAEILEEDLAAGGNEEGAEDAARIRRSARNLLTLINEVLDFSKIEAGRMELVDAETDVSAIVGEVIETASHIAQSNNNRIDIAIDPAVGVFLLDGQRLKQCLLNLVSNACKFTRDGVITVRADLERNRDGDVLCFAVIDTGCGVSEADQARLFQPFVQADGSQTRRHDGTGLGLAITRKLAQLMGGDVTMQSTQGVGSRFTLRVAAKPSADLGAAANANGPVILVIEDEAADRDLTRRALARLPFSVRGAATADDGLRMAAELSPALIVLDIHLPDRSGWDVLAALANDPKLNGTPVLVCTIDDDRRRALALGACDHFMKPIDRDQLAAAVLRYAKAAPASAAAPVSQARAVA